MGLTFALVQSDGNSPVARDLSNSWIIGAISSLSSLSTIGLISSGPAVVRPGPNVRFASLWVLSATGYQFTSPAVTQCTLCFLMGPVCNWLPIYETSNLAHFTIKIQKLLTVYS